MNKTFIFKGRTENIPVNIEVELELKNDNKNRGLVFSVVGNIYGKGFGYQSGQCQDSINDMLQGHKTWDIIYKMWKKWHLNGLRAGTKRQRDLLSKYDESISYDKQKEILSDNNLLEDDGFVYGREWLFENIEEEDLLVIKNLLLGNEGVIRC